MQCTTHTSNTGTDSSWSWLVGLPIVACRCPLSTKKPKGWPGFAPIHATMMRAVAAMSLLATACLALPGNQVQNQLKDEGDFVHRPLKWSGLERPDARVMLKDLSTKATHQHGAVQPFVATSSEKMAGYDTYRVYLLFDDSIGQSVRQRIAAAAAPPPPPPPSARCRWCA